MSDTAQADQEAAAARERGRREHQAMVGGEPAAIRTITVEADPGELEALERGEISEGIQAQIGRQLAEDEVIGAIEESFGE